MLRRRLIPKLQIKRASFAGVDSMVLVTTRQFTDVLEIGDPASQARIYEAQAADELICVDLDATREGRLCSVETIRRVAEQVCMPITVGGGVQTVQDIRTLLGNGADKVAINTSALEHPEMITEAARAFGAQCVVVSIDYRLGSDGSYRVYSHGGTAETGRNPIAWAVEAERRGAGEILLTSIDRDGMRQGLDCELTRMVAERVRIPVIASGGCGLARHFVDGFIAGRADAVSAGTYFCFKDENPMQTRSRIANAGIPIRLQRTQSVTTH